MTEDIFFLSEEPLSFLRRQIPVFVSMDRGSLCPSFGRIILLHIEYQVGVSLST
jgi:hypothetical protein